MLDHARSPNTINGTQTRFRLVPILAFEMDEAESQFLKSNARISSLQRVGGNSRLRTAEELLTSVTSEKDQLKSRNDSRPVFIAVIIRNGYTSCCCYGCSQCSVSPLPGWTTFRLFNNPVSSILRTEVFGLRGVNFARTRRLVACYFR